MQSSVHLRGTWKPLTSAEVGPLGAYLGVYEIRRAGGETVYLGVAGGRTLFGLRGELEKMLERFDGEPHEFRLEVNNSYLTRHVEVLAAYRHDHGSLPAGNADSAVTLGRLNPL